MVATDSLCSCRARACSWQRAPRRARAAFTLLEMLVVISIITIFAGVIGYGFLRGSGSATVGLQASQSIVVGLLTQARSQAVLTGRSTAVLVNADASDPDRFMRYLVPVYDGTWEPLSAGTYLPLGCYIVPNTSFVPIGPTVPGESWSGLTSSALNLSVSSAAVESTTPAAWLGVRFYPRGTTGQINNPYVVISTGIRNADGTFTRTNPNGVRGLILTSYGLPRLLDDRIDF